MHKWQEISYTLHGWWCSVLYDTPNNPETVQRYDGKIYCPTAGSAPLLMNPYSKKSMNPPPWATVVVHNPAFLETRW